MNKVLFVGSLQKGYFIEETHDVKYTGEHLTITEQINEILSAEIYSCIVIDVSQFSQLHSELVSEIIKIRTAKNCQIIIMAVGFSSKSLLIKSLRENGFEFFIFSPILSHQKREFNDAVAGISTAFNDEEFIEQTVDSNSTPAPEKRKSNTIAVVGAGSRIGTTTQAIQMVKYLLLNGFTAAYIEMNNNHYVERLKRLYSVSEGEEEIGRVTYQSVDMFYKKEKIADILKLEYDYLIYDFGAFTDKTFNLINFLEKDISVIVGGVKPNEIDNITDLISKTLINDVFYIFSFSHTSEHPDVLDLMEEKAQRTSFAIYSPDPFLYSADSNTIYEKIITLKSPAGKPQKRHKKFFKKRGKANNG